MKFMDFNMKLLYSVIITFLILFSNLLSDSLIRTKNGETYSGNIVEKNENFISLRTYADVLIRIPMANVEAIEDAVVEITTLSGQSYIGTITKEDESNIYFRSADGSESTIPKDKVKNKILANLKPEKQNTNSRANRYYSYSINDENYKPIDTNCYYSPEFWMFGSSIGTPGNLNLFVGYQTDTFGGTFTVNPLTGFELAADMRLITSTNYFLNLNVASGLRNDWGDDGYVGLKATVAYKSVFFELGTANNISHSNIYYLLASVGVFMQL